MPVPDSNLPPSGFNVLTAGARWTDVQSFVDVLAALPLHQWLRIGAEIAHDREAARNRAAAIGVLEAVVGHHHLTTAAWLVRDAADTAYLLASRSAPALPPEQRALLDVARGAAQSAALALSVADRLPARDLRMLLEPFAR